MEYFQVVARPRIHVGLIDMGNVTRRAYGSVGFAFDGPTTVWEVEPNKGVVLDGLDDLDDRAKDDLRSATQRICVAQSLPGVRATLRQFAPQHAGYGAKTSMLLALLAGVDAAYACGLNQIELQKLTRRGGASGVGCHSFFHGGVIWDGGHDSEHVPILTPSAASRRDAPPPLMGRWMFPQDWRVSIFMPPELAIDGDEESRFFAKNTPTSPDETHRAMAAVYHGILPAFASSDFPLLRAALRDLHESTFKARELSLRSERTASLMADLAGQGAAVGMSSLGPLVYAIMPSASADDARLTQTATDHCADFIGTSIGWNEGRQIERRHR